MYWSYLINDNNEVLTFETNKDINKMVSDYNELIGLKFFSQFVGYTKIFISNKNPQENPITNKLFELVF